MNRLRLPETWIYRSAVAFVLLFWLAHVASLPVEITYDGLGYIHLSDVLGSSRFPAEWDHTRTPLFPLSLKLAFRILGRKSITAILVPAGYALGGILLLGASVKRVSGGVAAAGTMALVSLFPTLIAYQHCVLTETGSFFFVSLTLYCLLWTPRRLWLRTAALVAALGIGYYWRQNILTLAPAAAALHVLTGTAASRKMLAAHGLAVLVLPFMLTAFWSPYLDAAGLRDTTLKQGMLRQALLPPEDPFVGKYRGDYEEAIRESRYDGDFISGMRWPLLTELGQKIWGHPAPEPIPLFFVDLARKNPVRYLKALGRTLAFFAGVNGAESDNRILRGAVLSEGPPGSQVSPGPEPLRSRIAQEFGQRTTLIPMMIFVRVLIPIYDPLLILASFMTVLGLAVAIWLRDLRLLAFCALPCVYALGYAVLLVSLDRFVAPVYPLALANLILVPLVIYRRWLKS